MKFKSVIVLGPTAVGKTSVGVHIANKFNGEIISVDSRQVYKHMDIGTGKDLHEYNLENKNIPYHLIDIIEPTEEFDLFKFIISFNEAFTVVEKKNKLPVIVGGTGMYLHAIIKRYELTEVNFAGRFDELNKMPHSKLIELLKQKVGSLHNQSDLTDKERTIKALIIAEKKEGKTIKAIDASPFIIGVTDERDKIKKRITERLKKRLNEGMIEEVKRLLEMGITHDKLNYFGLEYKYISLYLKGDLNYNDMYQKLNSAIHNFAKRQMTWYRKMEKEGIKINWIKAGDTPEAEKLIREFVVGTAG
ncbi:MAG: tRNA (adenosine(37)-N6)-dimethylallyltransferase MiaA [Ignavibacteria bacterium]|nr:MAG: tRNA (adenosine(37)-N6)-dimethylallyltransferase MiaA [Ignavibacteria bacterium]